MIKHNEEFCVEGVVARIVRSVEGGPIRQMGTTGSTKPTGTFISVKGGSRAMPWESMKCELPTLELAEVASPVVSLMAQPHRLELFVRRRRDPLVCLPDLELTVESSVFSRLMDGQPFADALIQWRPDPGRSAGYRTIVVEVKDDDDPRKDDPDYQRKLDLAAKVYRGIGIGFLVIVRSRDLACVDLDLVHDVALENYIGVSPVDVDVCMRWLSASDGVGRLGGLVMRLGGGATGREKASALHVRRVISIDLSQGFLPSTPVALVSPVASHRQSKVA
jgi:hypothetical protein